KFQQISGGDGFSTMGDGTQTYMFSFGPLSGLEAIAASQPGTEPPSTFNTVSPTRLLPGDPATTANTGATFSFNGAVGLSGDPGSIVPTPGGVLATGTATVTGGIINDVTITSGGGSGYFGPTTVTFDPLSGCAPD